MCKSLHFGAFILSDFTGSNYGHVNKLPYAPCTTATQVLTERCKLVYLCFQTTAMAILFPCCRCLSENSTFTKRAMGLMLPHLAQHTTTTTMVLPKTLLTDPRTISNTPFPLFNLLDCYSTTLSQFVCCCSELLHWWRMRA